MRALVYHGPGQKAWEEVPDPEITDDGDVDRPGRRDHDLRHRPAHPGGDVPEVTPGGSSATRPSAPSIEVGDGVHRLTPGDRVLVSCISACGTCRFCREGRYGQCLDGGGWVLGHRIDGTQAEYVRVPYADTSTYRIPDGVGRRGDPHAGRHPADRLRGRRARRRCPARRRGRRRGRRAGRPGRDHAARGCSARAHVVAIDLSDSRLEAARHFGADVTINDVPRGRR